VIKVTVKPKKTPMPPVAVWQKNYGRREGRGGKFTFLVLFHDILCNIIQQLIKAVTHCTVPTTHGK